MRTRGWGKGEQCNVGVKLPRTSREQGRQYTMKVGWVERKKWGR